MKKSLFISLLIVIMLFLVSCTGTPDSDTEWQSTDWEYFPLNTRSSDYYDFYTVDLEHSGGDIYVSTWDDPDEDRVGIRISVYGENPSIILEEVDYLADWFDDQTLDVDVEVPDDLELSEGDTLLYELKLPQNIRVDLDSESSEGNIKITDIVGNVEAETSNGNITIENIDTQSVLYVQTSNGNITTENVQNAERVELETSNGNIIAKDILSELRVFTSNGTIDVNNTKGRLEVENSEGAITLTNIKLDEYAVIGGSSGNILLDLLEVKNGNYEVESSDGDIEIRFPENIELKIDITKDDTSDLESNFLEIPEDSNVFTLHYPDDTIEDPYFSVETDGNIVLDKKE